MEPIGRVDPSTIASAWPRLAVRRWFAACAVVLIVLLLAALPQLLSGRSGVLGRLAYFGLEAPLIVATQSLLHHYATRRRFGTARTLVRQPGARGGARGLYGAVLFGLSRGLGWVPEMPGRHLAVAAAVAFGMFAGVCFARFGRSGSCIRSRPEDAGLRALQAETHRLEAETLRLEAAQLRAAADLARLRSQREPNAPLSGAAARTVGRNCGSVARRGKTLLFLKAEEVRAFEANDRLGMRPSGGVSAVLTLPRELSNSPDFAVGGAPAGG